MLSAAGATAEAAYRDVVHESRTQGRAALDAAQRSWAAPLGLEPLDGVILGELRAGRKGIADLVRSLEDCGTTQAEVRTSVDRLATAGLVDPAPAAAAA